MDTRDWRKETHKGYDLYQPKTLPHVEKYTQAKFSAGFWLAAGIMIFIATLWLAVILA